MTRRRAAVLAAALAPALLAAGGADAHGFGQRYDLPLPLSLYVVGAGAVVILSFFLVLLFMGRSGVGSGYPRVDLLRGRVGTAATHPALAGGVKALALAAFALVVVAGLIGNPQPARNLVPTVVWVVWWVGLAYVSALVGDVWVLLNPWRTSFGWVERLLRPGGRLSLDLRCPDWLGVWPALALFVGFAWLELVSVKGADPATLARAALVYSAITWTGMLLFGRERWLQIGEPFTLLFGLFARFAPTEIRVRDARLCEDCPRSCRGADGDCVGCPACFSRAPPARRELALRPFGAGLMQREQIHPSMTCFVILVLGTVTFDGLKETPFWNAAREVLHPFSSGTMGGRAELVEAAGLLAVPLLLLAAYTLTLRLVAAAVGQSELRRALPSFVLSLVPIAIGYHLAHYVSFLLVQGQLLIPLLSDPFGWGWDLWGSARYRIDIGIVGARFVWYWSVAAIVTGHVVAVVVAHGLALRAFATPREVARSQIPLLVLMVSYTMLSLWIVAQPIVEAPAR